MNHRLATHVPLTQQVEVSLSAESHPNAATGGITGPDSCQEDTTSKSQIRRTPGLALGNGVEPLSRPAAKRVS